MLKNYLTIAWRNLRAGKAYTAINIIGLAVGLAVCLVILLYIFEETSYDKQHIGADRFCRFNTSFKSKVDDNKFAISNWHVARPAHHKLPGDQSRSRFTHR